MPGMSPEERAARDAYSRHVVTEPLSGPTAATTSAEELRALQDDIQEHEPKRKGGPEG